MLFVVERGSKIWCSPCGLPSWMVILISWTWVLPFCSLCPPFFGCFGLYLISSVSSVDHFYIFWPTMFTNMKGLKDVPLLILIFFKTTNSKYISKIARLYHSLIKYYSCNWLPLNFPCGSYASPFQILWCQVIFFSTLLPCVDLLTSFFNCLFVLLSTILLCGLDSS
jgi:hypothetical protein